MARRRFDWSHLKGVRFRQRVPIGNPEVEEVFMPKAKQLTAWVEDRPGMLGEVTSALGAKKVNILAFLAGVLDGRGAIRMVVDKPAAAKKILAKHGWETTEEEVLQVTLSDKPGGLGAIAGKLGQAGVNIQYAYAGTAHSAAKVNVYFAVGDLPAALKASR
jgi:hypothetical protein